MAICLTNAGKNERVDVLNPNTRGAATSLYYGAWGSSGTAPALANTTLTEHPEARVSTTITQQTTSTTDDTIRYVWTVTASGNRSVEEAGVFGHITTAPLIYRATHPLLNIETADQVIYTVNDRQADSNLDGV